MAKRGRQGNDARTTNEEVNAGLFEPAFGFGGFGFEFGDGFDWVTGDADFHIHSAEFECYVHCARKSAIGFFVKTRTDGSDCIGEKDVVFDVEVVEPETGFDCGELAKHKSKV